MSNGKSPLNNCNSSDQGQQEESHFQSCDNSSYVAVSRRQGDPSRGPPSSANLTEEKHSNNGQTREIEDSEGLMSKNYIQAEIDEL